jgi:hypothetical protein
MKREGGIDDRDDKSSGIDIRMADALAKINPTDPFILANGVVVVVYYETMKRKLI